MIIIYNKDLILAINQTHRRQRNCDACIININVRVNRQCSTVVGTLWPLVAHEPWAKQAAHLVQLWRNISVATRRETCLQKRKKITKYLYFYSITAQHSSYVIHKPIFPPSPTIYCWIIKLSESIYLSIWENYPWT